MKNLKLLLLATSLVFSGGCSFLQSFHSQSPGYIDALFKEQRYSKAQSILNNITPEHPDYTALMAQKKRLQDLIKKLEADTLSRVKTLQQQNKWHQAQQALKQAKASLPQSQTLLKAEKDFLIARKKRIDELNMQLNIHKGIWLRDAEPLIDAIVNTQPDNYERRQQQQRFKQEKFRTLKDLVRCAHEAMDKELYELGRHCLELVEEIDQENRYSKNLQPARTKLQRYDHSWHQQQIKVSDALLKELKQGYSHENLLRASQHLQKLTSHNQTKDEQQYSTLLKQELDRGIAQSMDAGRKLYSEGKITEALSIWISLRKITPENEALEAHINRAQRVLDKLERLEKQQPAPAYKPAPTE